MAEIVTVVSLCLVGVERSLKVLMRTPRLPGSEPSRASPMPFAQDIRESVPMTDTAVPAVRPLEDVGDAAPRPPRSWGRRRVVLVGSAVAVFVAALLGLGTDALVAFGLLLAFSTDIDEEESGRAVVATPRNVALAAVMVAGFAWFWLERLDLTELELLMVGAGLIAMPLALQDAVAPPERRGAVWVTRRSLVLAISGAVIFLNLYYAYGENFNMLVTTCLVLPLVLAASRAWRARRGQLELGLLRHPLRWDVRPHLASSPTSGCTAPFWPASSLPAARTSPERGSPSTTVRWTSC